MRFSFIAIAFVMLLSAAFAANSYQMTYDSQGVRITKTIEAGGYERTVYRTDPAAGIVGDQYGAKVSISILNTNKRAVENLIISEDITWIPSTNSIQFSSAPNENNGRAVAWRVGALGAGESVEFAYVTDAPINPKVVSAMEIPAMEYSNPSAVLNAPRSAKQGDEVAVYLTGKDRKGAANAKVTVTTPLGDEFVLFTDSLGRAYYKPSDAGYYTYSVEGYDISFLPTTEIEQIDISGASTAAAISPDANKKEDVPLLGAIMGAWPIIAGIMLVALVAFVLYAYLNTSPQDDEKYEPLPPAPATRPSINDDEKGAEGGMSYKISYGSTPKEEGMKEQTRALLDRRKASSDASTAAKMQEEPAAQEGRGSQAAQSDAGVIEPKDEDEADEAESAPAKIDESRKKIAALPDANSKDHLPPWMNDNYEGETTSVDDETIRKTIEELEQLRSELQARQEGKSDLMQTESSLEDEGSDEETGEPSRPSPKSKPRIFPKKAPAKAQKKPIRKGRR